MMVNNFNVNSYLDDWPLHSCKISMNSCSRNHSESWLPHSEISPYMRYDWLGITYPLFVCFSLTITFYLEHLEADLNFAS